MKIVYICSPYRGHVNENLEIARKASRFAVDAGCLPIAPHLLLPQFMDEETERQQALDLNLCILDICQELWIIGDKLTEGMKFEISNASARGLRIVPVNLEVEHE